MAITAAEAVDSICAADAATYERDNTRMAIGQVAHQGDVYVVRVDRHEDVYALNRSLGSPRPMGALTDRRQVAPGTTQGSRHVVIGDVVVYAPEADASPLEGPTIVSRGEWTLTHPEHASHRFGAGTYVVTHQRDWAEEVRRVAD